MLLSSLALIPMVQKPQAKSFDSLSSIAMQVIVSLNSNGYLSKLIDEKNWNTIRSSVQSAVPLSMWFNLTVFDEHMTVLNEIPITSGSAVNDNIASADCVIASTNSNYAVYVVRLQLATVM